MFSRSDPLLVIAVAVLSCSEDRHQPNPNDRQIGGVAESRATGGAGGGGSDTGGSGGLGGETTDFALSCCALETLATNDALCADCIQLSQDEPTDPCGATLDDCLSDFECSVALSDFAGRCSIEPTIECVADTLGALSLGAVALLTAHFQCVCTSCAGACNDLDDLRCTTERCVCGDGICDLSCDELEAGCLADCTQECGCGNGVCEVYCNEDSTTCAADCVPCECGDGLCEPECLETPGSCSVDCGLECVCGDGQCIDDCGEDSFNCPTDCGQETFP